MTLADGSNGDGKTGCTCSKDHPNASTCDETGATKCKTGFDLKTDATCAVCSDANCSTCAAAAATCTACKAGFAL